MQRFHIVKAGTRTFATGRKNDIRTTYGRPMRAYSNLMKMMIPHNELWKKKRQYYKGPSKAFPNGTRIWDEDEVRQRGPAYASMLDLINRVKVKKE